MFGIQNLINLILILFALALIFWGLRLFKLYITLYGIFTGFIFGLLFVFFIWSIVDSVHHQAGVYYDYSNIPSMLITSGFVFAVIGGLIAWKVQKSLVFLISGAFAALLGIAVFNAIGTPSNISIIIGLILFLAGGLIAVRFYEYFIIIVMALSGAQIIFRIAGFVSVRWIALNYVNQYFQEIISAYSDYIIAFLFITAIYLAYAIYFQKVKAIKSTDGANQKNNKIIFRRVGYLFALIALTGYIMSFSWFGNFSYWNYDYLILSEATNLFGFNLISWPIIAVLFYFFISWLNERGYKYSFISNPTTTKIIYITLFGILVVPIVSWVTIYLTNYFRVYFIYTYIPFYKYFIHGPLDILITKWVFSFLIFPAICYLFILKPNSVSGLFKSPETKNN